MNNIVRKILNILYVIFALVAAVSIAISCDKLYLAFIFPLWVVSGYFMGYSDAVARKLDETQKFIDGEMEYVKDLEKELVEKTREIENFKKNSRQKNEDNKR
jgi:TRAP-type C4-dicarboxylate transport system permease large subunit